MKNKLKPILGWVALALLILFMLINLQPQLVNFFWIVKVEMPLSILILVSALLGAGVAIGLQVLRKSPPK